MIGLDPGRAQLNAAPDHERQRREHAAQWSYDHSVNYHHGLGGAEIETQDALGSLPRANVGEGRPL
jgi:hypothetical protein